MDLEHAAQKLGLVPFRIWKSGAQKATPKGTLLDGEYVFSYCCIRLNNDGGFRVPEVISGLLSKLESDFQYWLNISSSGGRIYLVVFSEEPEERYCDEFDFGLLSRLAKLKISLEFDV